MTAAVSCSCAHPPKFGEDYPKLAGHYLWCPLAPTTLKTIVATPSAPPAPRPCFVCGLAEVLRPDGRCSSCAKLSITEANAKIEARRKATEAALTAKYRAEQAAQHEKKERAEREALRQRFRDLLDGKPTARALTDGTEKSTGSTALVKASPVTLAVITQSTGTAEERKRLRDAMETATAHLGDVRKRAEKRLAEIAQEIAPVERQYKGLRDLITAVKKRGQRVVDGFTVYVRTDEEKAADQAEVEALRARLNATMEQRTPLDEERLALDNEEKAALRNYQTACDDYSDWLDFEQDERLDVLLAGDKTLPRFCRSCGTRIPFLPRSTKCCSSECARKPKFHGVWLPQCATCGGYFVADGDGGTGDIHVRDDDHTVDPVFFCSYRCLAASNEDLDDWPVADAACWSRVILLPHPPRSSAGRAALQRKKLLAEAKRRLSSEAQAGDDALRADDGNELRASGDVLALREPDNSEVVYAVLRAEPSGLLMLEIASRTGLRVSSVEYGLAKLRKDGRVTGGGRRRRWRAVVAE